jgi:hypothetical protein
MRREATEFYVVVILVIRRRRRDCEATAPALPTAAARASLYLAGVQMVRLGKYHTSIGSNTHLCTSMIGTVGWKSPQHGHGVVGWCWCCCSCCSSFDD